jgi:glycolate oxidase
LTYSVVTPEIIEILSNIVGGENVSLDPESLEQHSVDESPLHPHRPELVIKPESTDQVSQIVKLANKHRIPVTPQGSRTGLSGGSHTIFGGIALSMERMNRIKEIDEDNLMAVVEPGVLIMTLHEETEKLGLLYPPDPGEGTGTLGGNINTNAGGMRAMKYGVTRDFVNGLTFVTPTGEILNMGGKNVKDSTGYSLIDLIVGSEGTLGVVTEATLRLIPKPRYTALIYAPFNTIDDAAKAVSEIIKRKVMPYALEFLTQLGVQTIERYLERNLPDNQHAAYLMIGVEGNTSEELEQALITAGEACIDLGAVDAFIADTEKKQDELWEARKSVADALDAFYDVDEADICIPRSRIPEFIDKAMPIGEKYDITIVPLGHAGDGNIHVNVLRHNQTENEWLETIENSMRDLIELSISLGGTVSGEHGLGYTKKQFLPLKIGKQQIAIMKGIKKVFDPNGIMNPSKVLP